MSAPARLRKHQAGLLAAMVTCAAEHRAHGLDEDADHLLRVHDDFAARFLTSPQRISHTRRMGRVVFELIEGEAVE